VTSRDRGAAPGEWGALSGDLVTAPATGGTQVPTVFRVPVEVVGRAVDTGHRSTDVRGDPPQQSNAPTADHRFGLPVAADSLLRADQIPVFGDLGQAHARRDPLGTQVFATITDGPPEVPGPSEEEFTQRIPVLSDELPLSEMELTQRIPIVRPAPVPRYQPIAGRLSAAGPARQAENLSSLPDLPPVPTLPAMPPLPKRPVPQSNPAASTLPIPRVVGPPATARPPATPSLFTPNIPPTAPPAGAAEELMAQLRGMMTELE
jgi:hypothetical protein